MSQEKKGGTATDQGIVLKLIVFAINETKN